MLPSFPRDVEARRLAWRPLGIIAKAIAENSGESTPSDAALFSRQTLPLYLPRVVGKSEHWLAERIMREWHYSCGFGRKQRVTTTSLGLIVGRQCQHIYRHQSWTIECTPARRRILEVGMNRFNAALAAASAAFAPIAALATQSGSSAYGAGRIVGYVFLAVLALLVIRKLMKK